MDEAHAVPVSRIRLNRPTGGRATRAVRGTLGPSVAVAGEGGQIGGLVPHAVHICQKHGITEWGGGGNPGIVILGIPFSFYRFG